VRTFERRLVCAERVRTCGEARAAAALLRREDEVGALAGDSLLGQAEAIPSAAILCGEEWASDAAASPFDAGSDVQDRRKADRA
jgi:hypothetical protein